MRGPGEQRHGNDIRKWQRSSAQVSSSPRSGKREGGRISRNAFTCLQSCCPGCLERTAQIHAVLFINVHFWGSRVEALFFFKWCDWCQQQAMANGIPPLWLILTTFFLWLLASSHLCASWVSSDGVPVLHKWKAHELRLAPFGRAAASWCVLRALTGLRYSAALHRGVLPAITPIGGTPSDAAGLSFALSEGSLLRHALHHIPRNRCAGRRPPALMRVLGYRPHTTGVSCSRSHSVFSRAFTPS